MSRIAAFVHAAMLAAMLASASNAGELDPVPAGSDLVPTIPQVSTRQDRAASYQSVRTGRAAAVELAQQVVQWGAEWLLNKAIDEDRQTALSPLVLKAADYLQQNPKLGGVLIELQYERSKDAEFYSELASPRTTLRRVANSPRIIGYGSRAEEVLAGRFAELEKGPVIEAGGGARGYVQDPDESRYYWLDGAGTFEPFQLQELNFRGLQSKARFLLQQPQFMAAMTEAEETLQLERAIQAMFYRKKAATFVREAQDLLAARKHLIQERARLQAALEKELKKAVAANTDAMLASLASDALSIGSTASQNAGRQLAPTGSSPKATAVSERITSPSGATYERRIIEINGEVAGKTSQLRQLIEQSAEVYNHVN